MYSLLAAAITIITLLDITGLLQASRWSVTLNYPHPVSIWKKQQAIPADAEIAGHASRWTRCRGPNSTGLIGTRFRTLQVAIDAIANRFAGCGLLLVFYTDHTRSLYRFWDYCRRILVFLDRVRDRLRFGMQVADLDTDLSCFMPISTFVALCDHNPSCSYSISVTCIYRIVLHFTQKSFWSSCASCIKVSFKFLVTLSRCKCLTDASNVLSHVGLFYIVK